MSNYE